MALSFTGSTDNVQFGSDSELDDIATGAMLAWVFLTSIPAAGNGFVTKSSTGYLAWFIDGTLSRYDFEHSRATTVLAATAATGNFAAHGTNKWLCVAASWASAGANSDQKLYVGDLSTPLAEPSSYAVQQVGSGAYTSDGGGNLEFGNLGGGFPLTGRGATLMVWNGRQPSLGELRDQQGRCHAAADVVLFSELGWNGTGSQIDWSGRTNAGTVTGATLATHVPRGHLIRPGWASHEPTPRSRSQFYMAA